MSYGTHSGHGTRVCEFGTVHSRCRCPEESSIWIKCPTPKECSPGTGGKYIPKHRKEMRIGGRREVRLDP